MSTLPSSPSPLPAAAIFSQVTTKVSTGFAPLPGKARCTCSPARRSAFGLLSCLKWTVPRPLLLSRSPSKTAIILKATGVFPRYSRSGGGGAAKDTNPLVLIWNRSTEKREKKIQVQDGEPHQVPPCGVEDFAMATDRKC